jgi:hypothetical protein
VGVKAMCKKYYLLFSLVLFNQLFGACTPAGTAGNDVVTCTGNIHTAQQFYGGDDSVTLQNVSDVNYTAVYWLDESHSGNPATDGNDTFVSNHSRFFWVFGFSGDDTFMIDHSQFNNAYGDTNPDHVRTQRGNDILLITNSVSYGYILGGNDNDIMTIIDSNVSNVASGYSDIYGQIDYTPFDGNDTILLDYVNFTAPLYWDQNSTEGVVLSGKGDDSIIFRHGGEAYYVYGGHGNDRIEVYDNEHFNACQSSSQITDRCGIYGDESYASEPNATAIPILHGDDAILLHGGDVSGILIQGGDGSDKVLIDTEVVLVDTLLDGGDDRTASDGFVDQIVFNQWMGEVSGTDLKNWEQIIFENSSMVSFTGQIIETGYASTAGGISYGLIIRDNATWRQVGDFSIDGNVHNDAIIDMQNGDQPGSILQVAYGYSSDDGAIYLDTVLNDASSVQSDGIVIEGNSSGHTTLYINNIGGVGGQTPTGDNGGILVIQVEGNSLGTFSLGNRLEAGEYLYTLQQGSNGNWYLKSEKKYSCSCEQILSDSVDTVNIIGIFVLLMACMLLVKREEINSF